MAKEKATDVCRTFCFETERVNNALSTMLGEEILEETQVLFSALADQSRLKILYALRNGEELCVILPS